MKFNYKQIFYIFTLICLCAVNVATAKPNNNLNQIKAAVMDLSGVRYDDNNLDQAFTNNIEAFNLDTKTGNIEPIIIKNEKSILVEKYKDKISIFFVKDINSKKRSKVIVPIHGIYENHIIKAFLAIKMDGDTIDSLKLYQNGRSSMIDHTLADKKISKDVAKIQPYLDSLFQLKKTDSTDTVSGATTLVSNAPTVVIEEPTPAISADALSGATTLAESPPAVVIEEPIQVVSADALSGATTLAESAPAVIIEEPIQVVSADALSGATTLAESAPAVIIEEPIQVVSADAVSGATTLEEITPTVIIKGPTPVISTDAVSGATSFATSSKPTLVNNVNTDESVFYVWFSSFGYKTLLEKLKQGVY